MLMHCAPLLLLTPPRLLGPFAFGFFLATLQP